MSRIARKSLELELVLHRFDNFTTVMAKTICKIISLENCAETSNILIERLWNICRTELCHILFDELGVDKFGSTKQRHHKLSTREREVIREYIEKARAYEAEIGDLEDDEFEALHRRIMCPIVKAERERKEETEREADRWAFFNQPKADSVPGRWYNELLSSAQAVALSFGKDPDVVSPSALEEHRRRGRSPFKEQFRLRLSQVESAVSRGELKDPMVWDMFTTWASKNSILPSPSRLSTAPTTPNTNAFDLQAQLAAAQAEIRRLNGELIIFSTARQRTAFKLIIGMAVTNFWHQRQRIRKQQSLLAQHAKALDLR